MRGSGTDFRDLNFPRYALPCLAPLNPLPRALSGYYLIFFSHLFSLHYWSKFRAYFYKLKKFMREDCRCKQVAVD